MKHQGLNNRGEDIVTLDDMREYVEGEVEEIMNIIEGLGPVRLSTSWLQPLA